MFGIKSLGNSSGEFELRKQKLMESIKEQTQNVELSKRIDEINTKFDEVQNQLCELDTHIHLTEDDMKTTNTRITELENNVFGEKGCLSNIKCELDKMRHEYFDLIETYIKSNSLSKLADIENRLEKIENQKQPKIENAKIVLPKK